MKLFRVTSWWANESGAFRSVVDLAALTAEEAAGKAVLFGYCQADDVKSVEKIFDDDLGPQAAVPPGEKT
jgi:hypothetical protein